jgi:hypothetical protein
VRLVVFIALCVVTALPASGALADEVVPMPEGTRSVEVVDDGLVVHALPDAGAARRGTVKIGSRLPVRRKTVGTGCASHAWYEVGEQAFVCAAGAVPSPLAPAGEDLAASLPGQALPLAVGVVRVDGTPRYAHPSDYEAGEFVDSLGKGFAVVMGESRTAFGVEFIRTRQGYWVERDALEPPEVSAFEGVAIEGEAMPAWARSKNVQIYAAPSGARAERRASAREVFWIEGPGTKERAQLRGGLYARRRDLHMAERTARPATVGEHERWIDVDVASQILVAYEGDRPVFATLVSTGRPGAQTATPVGEHRIWVKLAFSDMDDLERTDVESNYSVEAVPWVQYFAGGAGFHTAYWHDDFGRARSHGCVNLSPGDAKRLFSFTGPALPLGWNAVLPSAEAPGTLVRVRGPRR